MRPSKHNDRRQDLLQKKCERVGVSTTYVVNEARKEIQEMGLKPNKNTNKEDK